MREMRLRIAGQCLKFRDPVDLVAEKFDAEGHIGRVGRENLQRIAVHAEGAAPEIHIIARVLHVHEPADHIVAVRFHTGAQGDNHVLIINRAAQSVDAGHRRDDNYVRPLGKCRRRRMAQLVDVVIDRGILLDIGIRLRHIRLRLIVIIIGNKIFHGVVREELLHLAVKLCGQRLVV